MGGYLATVAPLMGTGNFVKNVQSNYATPLIEVSTQCVVTNTTPVSAYRGAGRPEGNYFFERLLEQAAKETGRDAIELRRINHIKPEAFPFAASTGSVYDSGDFTAVLDQALAAADWDGFAARKAESQARGRLRGRGIGNFLECTAPPTKEQGEIRFNEDGTVTIITGTLDYGQGHWTPFAQVLHQTLGVPFERIRLVQGDSDLLIAGGGTGGSKSLMASGAAIVEAAQLVIEKGRNAAAHMLEAAVADIEFERDADGLGRFTIAGTDRGIGIMELAERIRTANNPPPDLPTSLDVRHVFAEAPQAYPNGCHIAEVEIEPDTGTVEVVRYMSVNDFGVIVNPLLVAGQAHGGIVQGIGQALYEHVAYSEEGQLALRQLPGLLPAARLGPAGIRLPEPPVALHDQSAGRQGLRRGGLRRLAAGSDECGGRCAVRLRHHPYRHAGDPGDGLARHPRGTRLTAKSWSGRRPPPAGQGAKPTRSRNSVNNHRFRATRRISAPSRGTGRPRRRCTRNRERAAGERRSSHRRRGLETVRGRGDRRCGDGGWWREAARYDGPASARGA